MSTLIERTKYVCLDRNAFHAYHHRDMVAIVKRFVEQGSKETANNPQTPQVEEKIFTDDELLQLIDPILRTDDTSNDGFIDYPEFIRAQQKSAANQQRPWIHRKHTNTCSRSYEQPFAELRKANIANKRTNHIRTRSQRSK